MELKQLLQLKKRLIHETDLSKVWSYYMDNFADFPEFIEQGSPKPDEFLESILPQICLQIFGKMTKITDLLPIYIPEYQFFHAPFFANHHIGGLIYFEDIQTGLIAISPPPPDDMVKYSRFSTSPRPKDKGFSYSPKNKGFGYAPRRKK